MTYDMSDLPDNPLFDELMNGTLDEFVNAVYDAGWQKQYEWLNELIWRFADKDLKPSNG